MQNNLSNLTWSRFLIPLLALTYIGCTGIKSYQAPQTEFLPQSWSSGTNTQSSSQELVTWWEVFNDPQLESLMVQAKQANLDLKQALSRLEESRIQLGLRKGEKWPVVNLEASATRQGTSKGQFFPGATFNNYRVALPVSWDLDLFGRIKNGIEASRRDYEAAQEEFASVWIRLFADVAVTHFEMMQVGSQLAVLEDNIKAIEQTVTLTKARAKHGLASGLEVAQAEQLLATTRAGIPPLKASLSQLKNRQAVLLGKPPQAHQMPEVPKAIPSLPRVASSIAGSPADLLRQRPDIRAAERRLAAQHARANVARAERFPNISISALIGRDSLRFGDLFDASSGIWNLGASLGQTLFNGGNLRRQVELQDARVETALLGYEKAVLSSLEEVENALVQYHGLLAEQEELEKAFNVSKDSVQKAQRLYKEGLTDFVNVLDTRRQQLAVQDQLAQVRGNTALGIVQIYLALGGGWNPDAPDPAEEHTVKNTSVEMGF